MLCFFFIWIICLLQEKTNSPHIFVRALLEACTQNLLNTENLTARLEGSILRNGVLTKLAQRYLDWVRDHPLKTSSLFSHCLTPPSPMSAFLLLSIDKFQKNLTPSPSKLPTSFMDDPLKGGRGMHHLLGFDKEWAVYGQPKWQIVVSILSPPVTAGFSCWIASFYLQ